MNKLIIGMAVAVTLAAVVIPLTGSAQMEPSERQRMQRHWATYMIPANYHDASSPIRATSKNVAAGAQLYSENCAGCHGKDGQGLGRSPGLLEYLTRTPEARNEKLLRVISAGRRRMPAFKSALHENEIRHIISYMRSGFPSVDSAQ
jgi:mono/diheme cytochrome c family protein